MANAAEKLASKMTKKDYEELPDKVKEGTCGYSVNGKKGKKPAGPNLLKKEFLLHFKEFGTSPIRLI